MTVVTVFVLVFAMARSASSVAIGPSGPGPKSTAPVSPAGITVSPLDQLNARADRDQPQVEQLVGYWVPQVSSKMLGTVDAGREYSYADILDNHEQWAMHYSPVLLLRSGDFGSFSLKGYWVTVVGSGYATAAQANSWCDVQGIPANDCFAKRLSRSSSAAGNTVHR